MVNLEVLEDVHERMYVELTDAKGDTTAATTSTSDQRRCDSVDAGDTTGTEESLRNRYSIARDQSNGIYLPAFLKDPKIATDPAFKVCTKLRKWKDTASNHMTNRISHIDYCATCSPETSSKSVSATNPITQTRNLHMFTYNRIWFTRTRQQGSITQHMT